MRSMLIGCLPLSSSWIILHDNQNRSLKRSHIRGKENYVIDYQLFVQRDENHFQVDTDSPRLYVGSIFKSNTSNGILSKGRIVDLSPGQSHYLTKVLRFASSRNNPHVRLFDGIDGEWVAQILEPSNHESKAGKIRKRADTILQAQCLFQSRPMPTESQTDHTWLFFAPIKMQRTKTLIEKCTEIGCSLFIPIHTNYTDSLMLASFIDRADVDDDKLKKAIYNMNSASSSATEKLSIIAMEASEQSEQLTVPKFSLNLFQAMIATTKEETYGGSMTVWSISELLEYWTENITDRMLVLCCERKDSTHVCPLLVALNQMKDIGIMKAAFVIGPEGGWSPDEELLFDRYTTQFPHKVMSVSLGSSILRAETAAIVATASFSLWRDSIPL